MNLIYPKLRRAHLPGMIRISLLGGWMGGIYGIFHDMVTYSISSEYFTRMKFGQFPHVDIGLPPRLFAAQIGFIAAGVVGLAAGWFISRSVVPFQPERGAMRKSLNAFVFIIVIAATAAAMGNLLGHKTTLGGMFWKDLCESLDISDTAAFLRVGLIHTAGYFGALLGMILAIVHLRRSRHHP